MSLNCQQASSNIDVFHCFTCRFQVVFLKISDPTQFEQKGRTKFFEGVAPKRRFFTCIFVFTIAMECVDSYWSVEPVVVHKPKVILTSQGSSEHSITVSWKKNNAATWYPAVDGSRLVQ